MGQVFIGGTWNLALYGKKASIPVLSGQSRPLASERIQMFKFQLCPGPLFPCGGSKTLFLGAAGGQSSLLYSCFSCMTYSFGLLFAGCNCAKGRLIVLITYVRKEERLRINV